MNKADLVSIIAHGASISKAQAATALDVTLEAVIDALKKGDKVTLVNFGTFSVTQRAARTGRNPRTNEIIKIKAKKVPKFRPGKHLLDAVEE